MLNMSRKLHFIHAIRGFLEGCGIPVALYLIAGMIGLLHFEPLYVFIFSGLSLVTGLLVGYTSYVKSTERLSHIQKVQNKNDELSTKKLELESTNMSLKAKYEVLCKNLSELKNKINRMEEEKDFLRNLIGKVIVKMNHVSHDACIQQIIAKYNTQHHEATQIANAPAHQLINPQSKHYYEEEKSKGVLHAVGYFLRKIILPVAAVISMVFGFTIETFEVAEELTEAAWHTLLIAAGAISLFFSGLSAYCRHQQKIEYREELNKLKTLNDEVHKLESDNAGLATEITALSERYTERSAYATQQYKLSCIEITALTSDLNRLTKHHNNVTSATSLQYRSATATHGNAEGNRYGWLASLTNHFWPAHCP